MNYVFGAGLYGLKWYIWERVGLPSVHFGIDSSGDRIRFADVTYVPPSKFWYDLEGWGSDYRKSQHFKPSKKVNFENPVINSQDMTTPMDEGYDGWADLPPRRKRKQARRITMPPMTLFGPNGLNKQMPNVESSIVVGRKVSYSRMLSAESELNNNHAVFRYQALGSFDEGMGAFGLYNRSGKVQVPTLPAGATNPWASKFIQFTWHPCYIIPLDQPPVAKYDACPGGSSQIQVPCIRQLCRVTQLSGITGDAYVANTSQYQWVPIPGVANAPDGIKYANNFYGYSVENSTGPIESIADFAPGNVIHKWTDVDIMLYGATDRPVKVHCDVVKFHNEAARPPRVFTVADNLSNMKEGFRPQNVNEHVVGASNIYNFDLADVKLPAAGTDNYGGWSTTNYADEESQQNTAAWDKFWATKSGHPMRTSNLLTSSDLGFHCISQSVHVLGNVETSDKNPAPFSKRIKYFVNGSGLRKSISAKNTVSQVTNPYNLTTSTLLNHGYPISSTSLTSSPFVDFEKDRWLMVWTSDFDTSVEPSGSAEPPCWTFDWNSGDCIPTPGNGSIAGPGLTADARHATFDVKLRTKCTYAY